VNIRRSTDSDLLERIGYINRKEETKDISFQLLCHAGNGLSLLSPFIKVSQVLSDDSGTPADKNKDKRKCPNCTDTYMEHTQDGNKDYLVCDKCGMEIIEEHSSSDDNKKMARARNRTMRRI